MDTVVEAIRLALDPWLSPVRNVRTLAMGRKPIQVLVLYGGDAATVPRSELVSWMVQKKKALNAEPKLVAWGVPHSAGSVAERVKREIDKADKAIAIVTEDDRSAFGAPNVLEEIGRWMQARGGETLCVIRRGGTEINSNMAGLVYLRFEKRIREVFDDLRDFIAYDPSVEEEDDEEPPIPPVVKAKPAQTMTIDANPNWVLIAGRPYRKLRIEETSISVKATVACADPRDESAMRDLARRQEVELVYGNHVAEGTRSDSQILHEAETSAYVLVSLREWHDQRGRVHDMSLGGPNGMSADEIAEARAQRLLTGEPRARKNDMYGPEMMIRGVGSSIQVIESPIPKLLADLSRGERATWERVRLELVRLLILTNCVEQIDRLSLKVLDCRLVHVDFKGVRHVSDHEPAIIEVNQAVDF